MSSGKYEIKKDNYIEYFETKDEDIMKLLKFLQNEVLLLKTDHYGYSKYEELVPENTKFFLNPGTEKNTFNYDLSIMLYALKCVPLHL